MILVGKSSAASSRRVESKTYSPRGRQHGYQLFAAQRCGATRVGESFHRGSAAESNFIRDRGGRCHGAGLGDRSQSSKNQGSFRPAIATRLLTGGTFFVRESESIGGFGVRSARAPAHRALSDFLSGGPRVENTPLSCGKQQTPEDSSAGALCKLVCRAISRLV
jgi:hypothetical protein